MILRLLIIASVCAFALPAGAGAATFKVTGSGSQELSWSLSGTRGTCEVRQGTGSGSTNFKFKTTKSSILYVSKSGIVGSTMFSANGTQTGSFTETTVAECPGFAPSDPFTSEATGCGPFKTNPRMDFKTKGAYTYVTGPVQSLNITGPCPHYIDDSLVESTNFNACGDSSTQYKRSWGVGSSSSRGLLASKLHISMKKLLKVKKGRKKTLTGKASVDCSLASGYSSPLKILAELKYSLTFKRTG